MNKVLTLAFVLIFLTASCLIVVVADSVQAVSVISNVIRVGNEPGGVANDIDKGEIFVANVAVVVVAIKFTVNDKTHKNQLKEKRI